MKHIYSTITNDVSYNHHEFDSEKNPHLAKSIVIKGGTGIATPLLRRGGKPETLFGTLTVVHEDDYELLKNHKMFQEHMARGYLRVEDKKRDAEKVVAKANMPLRDKSAPKTPDTDKEEGLPIAKLTAE